MQHLQVACNTCPRVSCLACHCRSVVHELQALTVDLPSDRGCASRMHRPNTARACSSHELAARLVWAAVLDTRWELGRAPTKRDGVLRALHRRLAALAVPTHGSPAISHRRRRAEAHDARSQSARSVVAGDLGRGASRFVGVRSTRSATVRAGARALSRHPHGLVPYAALPQERSLESVARCRRARAWLRMCVPYVHRITLSSDTQPQLAPCRARAAQHEPRRTSTARCRRVRAARESRARRVRVACAARARRARAARLPRPRRARGTPRHVRGACEINATKSAPRVRARVCRMLRLCASLSVRGSTFPRRHPSASPVAPGAGDL